MKIPMLPFFNQPATVRTVRQVNSEKAGRGLVLKLKIFGMSHEIILFGPDVNLFEGIEGDIAVSGTVKTGFHGLELTIDGVVRL